VKIIVFILLFFTLSLNAQILDNQFGNAFTDVPFFNETFISNNKLKALKGEYTFKKAGDIMRKTAYRCEYSFDEIGHLSSTFETRYNNGSKDTVHNIYEYNKENRLVLVRKKDHGGYQTVHYTLDSLGRIITIESRRDILNDNQEVEKSFVINKETMKYNTYPNQQKKTVFNSYNLPYLEEIKYYDSLGYLVNITEKLKMTSSKVTKQFEYNVKGLVSAIRTLSNVDGEFAEEWLYKYDDLGNLIEKHIYRNGKFVTDIQVIYNVDTKLLSSLLTRDVETNFIQILRFMDYEFY